jgi:hypothetical protein
MVMTVPSTTTAERPISSGVKRRSRGAGAASKGGRGHITLLSFVHEKSLVG